VYAWIWRTLPFGRWGKIVGSVVLSLAAAALLWFVVFPWAEPILPFDDVQVSTDGGVPGVDSGPTPGQVSNSPSNDDELSYSDESNNPSPRGR
jgi:hypothetical protein